MSDPFWMCGICGRNLTGLGDLMSHSCFYAPVGVGSNPWGTRPEVIGPGLAPEPQPSVGDILDDLFAKMKKPLEERQEKQMTFDFSIALMHLKAGHKVAREGWNGKGMYLALQTPDAHSKMGLPYIYILTVEGRLVPWTASQTDILAADWALVP